MKVKRYVAANLQEAMARVRQDLGRDAIILHTQKIQVGGIWGLFGKTMVEVTAATDDDRPVERPLSSGEVATAQARIQAAASATAAPAAPGAAPSPPPPPPASAYRAAAAAGEKGASPAELAALQREINTVKEMMQQMMAQRPAAAAAPSGQWSEPLQTLLEQLRQGGVSEPLASGLIAQAAEVLGDQADSSRSAREAVMDLLVSRLGEPAEIQLTDKDRRVVALIGPTGVGKTTTLAKLAAAFALGQRKSVALVTADTYRIAAVEQLRTYGEIIGVPVDVVFTEQELRAALGRHNKRDLVLIDTAGRSPRNAEQMAELANLLEAIRPDETHLVLSLTTSPREALEAARQFEQVGFDRLLLTKLDETSGPGLALDLAAELGKPLSYLTTGQNVPDDIEPCQPAKLAARLLGE